MSSTDKDIDLRNRAFALREDQQMEAAFAAIGEAAQRLPDDPQAAFAHAQIALETGRPAVALFEAARPLNAGNLAYIRSRAVAYAAEGQADAAMAQLDEALAAQPAWLDGHRQLANMRITRGHPEPERSYARAVQTNPQSLQLWLAWFHLLASGRNWSAARGVVDEGEKIMGSRPAFAMARVLIASESGEAADDPNLFEGWADVRDPGLDLCQVRHFLRLGEVARAEAVAARNLRTPAEHSFWPYLSLAWRLNNDDRAQWLDRPSQFIKSFDLAFTPAELSDLAQTLRRLHTARLPFLEQSVRGGTQTDGHLFLRHEPAIQLAHAKAETAIRSYIDELPAPEQGHPLLSAPRTAIRFEGSWSVRLASQGLHSNHTHTRGWISSALYVALPGPDDMGAPPSGWIAFGEAPRELAIALDAYRRIAPASARLVLFPSTMWHGTMPFNNGERLTLAFDVRRMPA